MIHDATGKFSSRWVFPDRRSLAVVMGNLGYTGHGTTQARMAQAHAGICEPHIGEYATKTNAICNRQHSQPVAGTNADHGPDAGR